MSELTQDYFVDSTSTQDYKQLGKSSNSNDEFDKYNVILSIHWQRELPVFTKSNKFSFHRKGNKINRIKTKQNPLWSNNYTDVNLIYLDNPNKLDLIDILSMEESDWRKPGFWANPYSYEFRPNFPESQSRAAFYYKWLHSTVEGARRLHILPKLRWCYLVTQDLLYTPLYAASSLYHYGQILMLLRWHSYGYLMRRDWMKFKFVPEKNNSIVFPEPSFISLAEFYCLQMNVTVDEIIKICKNSSFMELADKLLNSRCYEREIPF